MGILVNYLVIFDQKTVKNTRPQSGDKRYVQIEDNL